MVEVARAVHYMAYGSTIAVQQDPKHSSDAMQINPKLTYLYQENYQVSTCSMSRAVIRRHPTCAAKLRLATRGMNGGIARVPSSTGIPKDGHIDRARMLSWPPEARKTLVPRETSLFPRIK